MADYLEYYALLDVVPFVEALSNVIKLFAEHSLDISKDSVMISTTRFLLKSIPAHLKDEAYFYCPSKRYRGLALVYAGWCVVIFKWKAQEGTQIHTTGVEI